MDNIISQDSSLALMQAAQAKTEQLAKEATSSTSRPNNDEKLSAVAQDFEAVFIAEMMKPMFAGIKTDKRFGGGKGEEVFRGMMIQEYGKMMAETGQIGIADSIKSELIRLQDSAQ